MDATHREVAIPAGTITLAGDLAVPEAAVGAVAFAHAGVNDLTPRTQQVTDALNEAGLATLALDLVDEQAEEPEDVFDVELLAPRLEAATRSLRAETGLPIVYLGVGTAASAALWAAGDDTDVRAVVAFGSWPDLAASHLATVTAPTLLIVGGADGHVLELNRAALEALPACEHELAVVPGATHLFEQSGALEEATHLAVDWFVGHLPRNYS